MMRKLIAVLILCNPGFAAVCTSQATGNWDVIAWSCGHPPTTADSTVIATGNTVTVESGLTTAKTTGITYSGTNPTLIVASGGTLNAGTMTLNGASVLFHAASGSVTNLGTNTATNSTIDVTVTLGTFTVDNGGTLNLTGSLKSGPTGTANLNGHTVITPNGTAIHQDLFCNSSSTGSAQLNIVGASHASPAVVEDVNGQLPGGGSLLTQTAGSSYCDVNLTHAIMNNFGDTTNNSILLTTVSTPSSITFNDFMINNFGRMSITTNSGVGNASTFSINGWDWRNYNGTSNNPLILASANTTVPSAPRTINNVTCNLENFTGTQNNINITGSNFTFGSSTLVPSNGASDVAGIHFLNCSVTMTGINNVFENWFGVSDVTSATQPNIFNVNYSSSNMFYNSVAYVHAINPHWYYGAGTGTAGNNNLSYGLYDGDMWHPGDSGSLCMGQGTFICNNNILVNGNGNLSNTIGTPGSLIMDNNLLWNQASSSEGESTSNALQIQEFYDNLFPCPLCIVDGTTFPPGGTCSNYMSGANQISAWLTQTNFLEDNNWKYNFPNEGDPQSITCSGNSKGVTFPFLGIFSMPAIPYRGPTSNFNSLTSTSGTGTNCPGASCELDYLTGGFTSGTTEQNAQPNDVLYNDTNNTWTTVSSVSSNTKLFLNMGTVGNMTSLSSGNQFSVIKGLWQDHSAIGSATNRGLHDIHAFPTMYNPGASICTWYNTIGGALTCPTNIAATGRTDFNIQTIAHMALTINGWDQGTGSSLAGTNCSANCPQRVTPWAHTSTDILKYIGQQYRVYNGMAKNAGHTGGDVGPAWIPNYPPAILSF